jgi:hypothetical protein
LRVDVCTTLIKTIFAISLVNMGLVVVVGEDEEGVREREGVRE